MTSMIQKGASKSGLNDNNQKEGFQGCYWKGYTPWHNPNNSK